jgi:hypothetical protein
LSLCIYAIGRERFALGSMSHLLNSAMEGYQPLPDFPAESADATLRDVIVRRRPYTQGERERERERETRPLFGRHAKRKARARAPAHGRIGTD